MENEFAEDVARLLDVVVEQVQAEADGVVSLALVSTTSEGLAEWTAGSHIDVVLPSGLERQYSLCGDVTDSRRWRIAILEEVEGRGGSRWLHRNVRAGDTLQIRGPRNHFALLDAPSYLFVAGGIGITPILAMIQSAQASGANWQLLYGGRKAASMAFVDELRQHGDRVQIRPQDEFGLLDLTSAVQGVPPGTLVYCCGPEPLIAATEAVCAANPHVELHVERFAVKPGALQGANTPFEVELRRRGLVLAVGADESIVDAMQKVGISHPTSCAEGICGTCETDVLDGEPDHRDSVLSAEEKALNETMMVCCSRSLGARLVLDL